MYCTNLPPCPEPRKITQDGGWGPFGTWSECSASCDGGFRLRRRVCNDPIPQNGGVECFGCSIEYETCNIHKCPGIQKLSPWTPWLQSSGNMTRNEEQLEKRFRFICKVNTSDIDSIKIVRAKEETRKCFLDGSCHRIGEEYNEQDLNQWSSWSDCTAECGGGQQHRTRICARSHCEGNSKLTKACNTHPCEGLFIKKYRNF